ncbi:hypothetical protein [Aeromonas cavernicola]|uniref:hypothetical protein n=1 Tax=Aeromonas cavernicola TaxID=1006623 RepID=UPI001F19C840|nr:hypothetical protein [Aeromonas cavernicola]
MLLVIALPLSFFLLGQGEVYLTWGSWISGLALMIWLLCDIMNYIRPGKGE